MMLKTIHTEKKLQLGIGFMIGIFFGFFIQKGGVTNYDVIIGQLLLTDFTVTKIMASAVITGMFGVYLLRHLGLVQLHPKPGSIGSTIIGGLIFGIGFAVLGYCPGIVAGAIGQGSLDALFGGLIGILIGAGLFAEFYPKLEKSILNKGHFGEITWPELFKMNPWLTIFPLALVIITFLFLIEIFSP